MCNYKLGEIIRTNLGEMRSDSDMDGLAELIQICLKLVGADYLEECVLTTKKAERH